jgi:hypothetical protein
MDHGFKFRPGQHGWREAVAVDIAGAGDAAESKIACHFG